MTSFSAHQSRKGNHSPTMTEVSGFPASADAQFGLVSASNRTAVLEAYRAMETAFIRWHAFGCFAAAAEYHKARQAWELALMGSLPL